MRSAFSWKNSNVSLGWWSQGIRSLIRAFSRVSPWSAPWSWIHAVRTGSAIMTVGSSELVTQRQAQEHHAHHMFRLQSQKSPHKEKHTRTHRETQRDTHTDTHRETHIHRDRHANRHTQTHRETHTDTHTHTHTHRDTHTHTHRHTRHTQTERHSRTDTYRDTQTHTDTHTQTHSQTHTQTQTWPQAHTHSDIIPARHARLSIMFSPVDLAYIFCGLPCAKFPLFSGYFPTRIVSVASLSSARPAPSSTLETARVWQKL